MNLYAYVANDPLNNTDPSGAILDTLLDAYEVLTSVGRVAGATAAYAVGVATGDDRLASVAADGLREARVDVAIAGAAVTLPFVSAKVLHALKGASNIAENAVPENVDPRTLIPRQGPSEMDGSQIGRLRKDMRQNGFDPDQPIDVADVDGRRIILDGHHRAAAARQAGVRQVPIRTHSVTPEQADLLMHEAAKALRER